MKSRMTLNYSKLTLVTVAAVLYFAGHTVAGAAFSKVSSPYIVDVWMVLKLFEDLEGRLWIGTEGGGLTRFEAGQFSCYSKPL